VADDRETPSQADRARIDMTEACEVRYWTRKFGLTKQQLTQVVNGAGPRVADVKRQLGY
jgi:hypothetical protein